MYFFFFSVMTKNILTTLEMFLIAQEFFIFILTAAHLKKA